VTTPILRLGRLFLLAFALVAAAAGFWAIAARDDLIARHDNPRNVLAEQQIQRGEITDRNGQVLAETTFTSEDVATRTYPHPEAAPAVGYYSLRYGIGGVEAELDPHLRGTLFLTPSQALLDRTLHRPLVGGDVQLTLDVATQQVAAAGMQGRKGAVVALNAVSGDVLALVSAPSFDPAKLDEQWDALTANPDSPLLNRATQGLYQPGTAFLPVVMGEALNRGLVTPETAWDGGLETQVASSILPCAGAPPTPITRIEEALIWGCPAPIQKLGAQLGTDSLAIGLDDFGLNAAPAFSLPTIASAATNGPDDVGLLAVGQSQLTVTPLQLALVAAAFANHGQMPAPRLVEATRPPGGEWADVPASGTPRGTISRANADAIAGLMHTAVSDGAAHAAYADRLSIAGLCGLAIRGPQQHFDTWFMGFATPPSSSVIAIVVLLEDTKNCSEAARIGREVLLAVVNEN